MPWLLTSLVTLAAWIPCETLGGLIFLQLGIRLWSYHITPVFWELTSVVAWVFVFFVAGTNCFVCWRLERRWRIIGGKRWLFRAVYLMLAGPFWEVVWNHLVWWAIGTPIYLYTVLPTFSGSGSWLSPLYYLTLLSGFWVEEIIRVPRQRSVDQ